MSKQDSLKPVDLAVIMIFAVKSEGPKCTYSQLGHTLGISSSTSFEAVKRLETSGLLIPGTHEPNLRELRNFIAHGVKHSFPPVLGREVRGVPTAHAGPALKGLFDSSKPIVWPDAEGSVRGTGLTPLYPNATQLPSRDPEIYDALTLVDAVRVGHSRERNAALAALDKVLGTKSA